MLDGYKESIDQGLAKVLAELDPLLLEKSLKNEKLQFGKFGIPYKYIPFYIKIKLNQLMKTLFKKIRTDINAVERKYFRPSFMKGYQKRILARSEDE